MNVTEETITGLHDRRFDLGFISLPVPEKNLKIIPLFDEELLIVRPSTSKVRGPQTGSVRVSELARVPFLLYPVGTVLRVLIDRFFTDIGVNPHVVMEAEDTEAIKAWWNRVSVTPYCPSTRSGKVPVFSRPFGSMVIT